MIRQSGPEMIRLATKDPIAPNVRAPLLSRLPLYIAVFAPLAALALATISLPNLSIFYLRRQDQWLLLVGAATLILCFWSLPDRRTALAANWRLALAVGVIMALAAFVGHYGILSSYDLSRDEQLANFDAAILAKGHLLASLPARWQDHTDALNATFMYPTAHRVAWASGYLPVNAVLRASIGVIAAPEFTGPLMTLFGALALWACARRIWPESREAPIVALLLYLGSGQIWLNGMTAYAMPAHLTVNLCWLWLVLRRAWWADVSALALGFFAVGLHQIHYHPLFAAPILLLVLLERNWRRAAFFALGYLMIGLFWQWWTYWNAALAAGGAVSADSVHANSLGGLIDNLAKIEGQRIPNMAANLFRLIAWEHLLLVPLVLLGIRAARDRLAAALVAGIVLTLLVRFIALPYQGHGLGYRYIHGLIGNLILLAVYGWVSLGDDIGRWRALLLRSTAASCLVLLPLQAWMTHEFYATHAEVSRRIDAASADYAVVGDDGVPFFSDLVRNSPFLDNRPIRLIREELDPRLQAQICAGRPSIALVGSDVLRPITDYFEMPPALAADAANRDVAEKLRVLGCRVEYL